MRCTDTFFCSFKTGRYSCSMESIPLSFLGRVCKFMDTIVGRTVWCNRKFCTVAPFAWLRLIGDPGRGTNVAITMAAIHQQRNPISCLCKIIHYRKQRDSHGPHIPGDLHTCITVLRNVPHNKSHTRVILYLWCAPLLRCKHQIPAPHWL